MKLILSNNQLNELVSTYSYNEVDLKAREANTNPTQKQKEAGNYKKGHVRVAGMSITIENPAGSSRKWFDENGQSGSTKIVNHYGYFTTTKGKDGDAVDVFLGPNIDNIEKVYVVDQRLHGQFDESKVMLGFDNIKQAKQAYLDNYEPGWKGLGSIIGVPLKIFKKWLYRGRKQRKPFKQYILTQKNKILKESLS